jgi:RNA polymerase sigma factor (sigma-70 family)
MTLAFETVAPESQAELAARFTREARPLIGALRRHAWRLTRNHADADELLQETLLNAYSGFRNFQPGTNFKAWIFRIQHNRWCTDHRRRLRRPDEMLTDYADWAAGQGATGPAEVTSSAETQALAAFALSDVHAAMGPLPAGMREALYYNVVAGYSYAETAAMMDIPIGTVMSRLSRGRRRLRITLARTAPGGHHHDPEKASPHDHTAPPASGQPGPGWPRMSDAVGIAEVVRDKRNSSLNRITSDEQGG